MARENEEDADGTPSTEHDGSTDSERWDRSSLPSIAIVEAIADATHRDPTALPSLHHAVDPDALDTILTQGMQQGELVHVSFSYDGVSVSAGSDGTLSIEEP